MFLQPQGLPNHASVQPPPGWSPQVYDVYQMNLPAQIVNPGIPVIQPGYAEGVPVNPYVTPQHLGEPGGKVPPPHGGKVVPSSVVPPQVVKSMPPSKKLDESEESKLLYIDEEKPRKGSQDTSEVPSEPEDKADPSHRKLNTKGQSIKKKVKQARQSHEDGVEV